MLLLPSARRALELYIFAGVYGPLRTLVPLPQAQLSAAVATSRTQG